jgi:hypothetical protein
MLFDQSLQIWFSGEFWGPFMVSETPLNLGCKVRESVQQHLFVTLLAAGTHRENLGDCDTKIFK